MASVDALVNIGRGATFGLTDTLANWISPGASCTVPQDSFDQALGGAASSLVAGGLAARGLGWLGTLGSSAGEDASALIRLGSDESWANPRTLEDHFLRHGADFGATSADQYAADASEFLQRAQADGLPTKIASDGTIRIYDPATNTFGSYSPSGLTKTFFRPASPGYWARQPGVAVP